MPGFQVKVMLEGTKPPLWRRILLPDRISFADLHDILQIVFGWDGDHMHDFSFQKTEITISDTKYTDADADEQEEMIDAYLQEGWIRYTYDFGDNWEHKITLEKSVEDYDERYPAVLAHRRNNMEEDSGGVWFGAESDVPYDEAAVNYLLKKRIFCEPLRESEPLDMELLGKMFRDCINKMDMRQGAGTKQKKSNLERRIEKIRSFYEKAYIAENVKTLTAGPQDVQKVEGGQLVFDFDTGETAVEEELPDYSICKADTFATQDEFLERHGEQYIIDFAKYLMIPKKKGRSKQKTIETILQVLEDHPEYYLIFLDEEAVQAYLSILGKKPGELLPDISEDSLVILCAWGLCSAVTKKIDGKNRMDVLAAAGNEKLRHFLETAGLHRFYSAGKLISDRLNYLIKSYGFIELSALHDKYQKVFEPIVYEDLMRYLYLDGTMLKKYITGVCILNNGATEIAAVYGMNLNWVPEQLGRYGRELDYADFKSRQLLKWKEGIGGFVPAWNELADMLIEMDLAFPEEIDELLPQLYMETMSGEELDELAYRLEDAFIDEPESPKSMMMLTLLWKTLAQCWLDTPLACLKGYSRTELGRRTGEEPFTIAVDTDFYSDSDELEGDEQIYELPWDMQQKLYYLMKQHMSSKNKKRSIDELNKIAAGTECELIIFKVLEKMFLAN